MPRRWKEWFVNLLDPGRDERGVMTFGPSGDVEFNVARVLASEHVQSELARIAKLKEAQRKTEEA